MRELEAGIDHADAHAGSRVLWPDRKHVDIDAGRAAGLPGVLQAPLILEQRIVRGRVRQLRRPGGLNEPRADVSGRSHVDRGSREVRLHLRRRQVRIGLQHQRRHRRRVRRGGRGAGEGREAGHAGVGSVGRGVVGLAQHLRLREAVALRVEQILAGTVTGERFGFGRVDAVGRCVCPAGSAHHVGVGHHLVAVDVTRAQVGVRVVDRGGAGRYVLELSGRARAAVLDDGERECAAPACCGILVVQLLNGVRADLVRAGAGHQAAIGVEQIHRQAVLRARAVGADALERLVPLQSELNCPSSGSDRDALQGAARRGSAVEAHRGDGSAAVDPGQGDGDGVEAALVVVAGVVSGRAEIIAAGVHERGDRRLPRIAGLIERFLPAAEVVDDDLASVGLQRLHRVGVSRYLVRAGAERGAEVECRGRGDSMY